MLTFLQASLLLGVAIPLISFVFLAFFGTKLSRPQPARAHGPGHGHGHDEEHGHAAGRAAGEPLAGYVATAAIGLAFVLALAVTIAWGGLGSEQRLQLANEALQAAPVWLQMGNVPIRFGVRLDSLTVIMFLMVTLTATCIHVFSIGYMKGDSRFARFFTYLSLFCFSMLGLVLSTNLVFLFMFWELVGVCSYLLIGFWFEKKSASNAAIKAFVVNRVGDFGFMIGLGLCFTFLGSLSLDGSAAVFEAAAHHAHAYTGTLSDAARAVSDERVTWAAKLFSMNFLGLNLASWLGIGLFCGAIGKSAQVPLQVWLPDAMEGPTPVSALIHAATMVAAGVYLVARIYALLTPQAALVIAVIGCITLTMAALIACVQTDIKRVLAYSTLSQLGFMIFALGVGAWIAALFHLLTHAFFKALLFLGSGQVIAGCHHEQDIRRMGGLWVKMPNTARTFLIAVLAISGAGIPWTRIGIGGFYSKDEILAGAYHRAHDWAVALPHDAAAPAEEHAAGATAAETNHGATAAEHAAPTAVNYPGVPTLPWVLFLLPVLVTYITPFYMGRCFVLTFLGRPRDAKIHAHAHESPLMYGPLLVLAAMTLVSGWFVFRQFVAATPHTAALLPSLNGHTLTHAEHVLGFEIGFAWLVGLGFAYVLYRNGLGIAERVVRLPVVRVAYVILVHKFYFDEVYGVLFVTGTRVVSLISRLFDNWVIDGLVNVSGYLTERIAFFSGMVLDQLGVDGLVNTVGRAFWGLGGTFRAVQTGFIRNYILLAVLALTGLLVSLWSPAVALVLVLLVAIGLVAPRSERRRVLAGEGS